MHRHHLLMVTAVVESGTGLLLLLLPAVPLALLLGLRQLGPEVMLVSRVAGAGLLAIGVASWLARTDGDGPAQRGLLIGVLVYDAAATVLLTYAGLILRMVGIALWPAVTLHAALAVWCLLCLNRSSSDRSPQKFAGGNYR